MSTIHMNDDHPGGDSVPHGGLASTSNVVKPTILDQQEQGFVKQKKFQDVAFAMLFLAHLLAITIVLLCYSPTDIEKDWTFAGVWQFVWINSAFAVGLSTFALIIMSAFSELLVQIALIGSVLSTLVVAIRACIAGTIWLALVGFICFILGLFYVHVVWNRIPFAATNLKTAIQAVKINWGLIIVAYLWLGVAFGFALFWMNATGAAMNQVGWGIVFLYLASFFWTQQVIQNIINVICASVIGAWWYEPAGASRCWDKALNSAILQATSYNLGSIALGSLLGAFVQALKQLNRMARQHRDKCGILVCMADCLLSCVEGIVEYFNKWAYTYVGIHGTSYRDSGKMVKELFAQRGWSSIITDTLADGVMWLVTLAVALLTGLTVWATVNVNDDVFVGIGVDSDNDDALGFSFGFLIGLLMASVLTNVLSAAVNAIIVCFAEAPTVFNKHYPDLADDLLVAWLKSYPEECNNEYGGYTPPPTRTQTAQGQAARPVAAETAAAQQQTEHVVLAPVDATEEREMV